MNQLLSRIRKNIRPEQELAFLVIIALIGMSIFMLIHGLFSNSVEYESRFSITMGVTQLIYISILYFYILPRISHAPAMSWTIIILNGILIAIIAQIEPENLKGYTLLLTGFAILGTAILAGRWPTYVFTFIAIFSKYLSYEQYWQFSTMQFWINTFAIPALAVITTETILVMKTRWSKQLTHMQIINNVARSLSSSLDTHQVIALMSSSIQNALLADTYYIGLLEDDHVRLALIFDDGEFYPSTNIPLESTLAGWVVKNRTTLHSGDIQKEFGKLGIHRFQVGQPRPSRSWMGVPLESGGQVLGVVAVASYKKHAFSIPERELLQNIARQAALALDNAFHHGEVQRQSRLDSLTQAINHENFINALEELASMARGQGQCLSLIMLDIDRFKQYNDTYGHLVGDRVLRQLTEIIRKHIKSTDLLGRWGGEEFIIALPGANGHQAFQVAERIRRSMGKATLKDRNGRSIASPSISQGMAVFPLETTDVYTLIDMADQRLYVAKDRGRNEIEPGQDFWKSGSVTNGERNG